MRSFSFRPPRPVVPLGAVDVWFVVTQLSLYGYAWLAMQDSAWCYALLPVIGVGQVKVYWAAIRAVAGNDPGEVESAGDD